MIYKRILEDRILFILREKKSINLGALILLIASAYEVKYFDALRQRIYRSVWNLEKANLIELSEVYKGKKLIYKLTIK